MNELENLMNLYVDNTGVDIINWYPETGTSWMYYVNTGDYKLEDHGESIVADILVAGVSKKDIEAYVEDKILKVTSSKPGWNGNVNVTIDLTSHKVSTKNLKIKLSNGVLRVEFPKVDEKIKLEIK